MFAFTITVPPEVDDDLAYQLFNNWLTVCRKYHGLKNYIWVREFQQNETVHFHMLVPHYLHVVTVNRAMQECLKTQVRNGRLKWHIKQCKRYNGVHIGKNDKTKKVTNFAKPRERRALLNYMLKYMSKGKVNDKSPNHYAWHNSRAFSKMITSLALTHDEALQLKIRQSLNMNTTWTNERFTHILWKDYRPPDFVTDLLSTVNAEILQHLEFGNGKPLSKKLELPKILLN
jgi:hypothetical protein